MFISKTSHSRIAIKWRNVVFSVLHQQGGKMPIVYPNTLSQPSCTTRLRSNTTLCCGLNRALCHTLCQCKLFCCEILLLRRGHKTGNLTMSQPLHKQTKSFHDHNSQHSPRRERLSLFRKDNVHSLSAVCLVNNKEVELRHYEFSAPREWLH